MDSLISQIAQFCEHCGTQVVPNTKFCQGCGKPVPVAAPFTPSFAPPIAPEVPPLPQPAPVDNYARVQKLYKQAAQVDPMQRDAFLVSMCDGDASLLQELRSMFATEVGVVAGHSGQDFAPGTPVTAAASTSQAYMIGAYRLLRELGRGGMGVVYLAVRDDGAFRKNVALKLLLRECVTAEFISRFKQERQVLAALDHPNIARILDGGDTPDGMPYYVMEYVEGLPLDRYCDQQRLPLNGRIKTFQQVCLAVDYLHQNSILHRDLKPSNILVSSDGIVKLLDFGIAKVVGAGSFANPELTTAEGRPMTPTYASPEQLSGATLHKTSDLYSLGAILYTLLTGRSAYNDLDDKLAKIEARETPTKPSTNIREDLRSAETTAQFRRAMMGELDSIVLKAMQIDAKDRYQSAADLAQDLQRFLDGAPVTAYHRSAADRGVNLIRRKSTAVAVLCGFLLLGALGAWQWSRLEHQKSEASATEARLSRLVDTLEARLNNVSAPPVEDVQKLKDAFQKELPAVTNDDALLARGVKYLDHVRSIAPASANLNVQVGDAYEEIGKFQEKEPKSSNGSRSALVTYQKAANTLATADTSDVKQDLAAVNAHIRALGGPAVTLPSSQVPALETTPAVQTVQTTPIPKASQPQPVKTHQVVLSQPVAYPPQQQPQTPAVKEPPPISAETEERLVSVGSKVEITDQTIEPIRQNLQQTGQALNADTLTRIARMHASLDRAKRAVASGNEADAKESLTAAEALADKILHSVGR